MALNDFHPCNHDWYSTDGNFITCELCPRKCKLSDGSKGFCGVRQNKGGTLISTVYNRISAFHIDPVEKKPLHHFLPSEGVASFGTVGCNLGCEFCQNWELSRCHSDVRKIDTSIEKLIRFAVSNQSQMIAYTYNEPLVWAEFAIDVAQAARENNLKNIAVTAGYAEPAPRRAFFNAMDAANVDLKAFDDAFYKKYTGARLSVILDTLTELAHKPNFWLEITTLLIPGENDSDTMLEKEFNWIANELGQHIPVHLSAFHPDYKMLNKPCTPIETLQRAKKIAQNSGLLFVYLGNTMEPAHTRCPQCGNNLIERWGYDVTITGLKGNQCQKCCYTLPGVFRNHENNTQK